MIKSKNILKIVFFFILMLFTTWDWLIYYFKFENMITKIATNNTILVNVFSIINNLIISNLFWVVLLMTIFIGLIRARKMNYYNLTWLYIDEIFQHHKIFKISLLILGVKIGGFSLIGLFVHIIMGSWEMLTLIFKLNKKGWIQII